MSLYDSIINKTDKISLIGLGYVGVPIAVAFSKRADVIGYDISGEKIELLKSGVDPTGEVGSEALVQAGIEFTSVPSKLREARFHIIAVPTQVRDDKTPDLIPLVNASRTVG